MSRHFLAIGHHLTDAAGLARLAREAAKHGTLCESRRAGAPPLCFHWDLGRGLSVFVNARKNAQDPSAALEIVACLPAFLPEEKTTVAAYRLALAQTSGEARLRARLADGRELCAALPNLAQRDDLAARGGELGLHLAGLGVENEVYAPQDAPRLILPESEEPQTQAFLPLDRDAHVRLLGPIVARREVVNFLTGARLWVLHVACGALVLPLTLPIQDLPRPPQTGDLYLGTAWLVATLPPRSV